MFRSRPGRRSAPRVLVVLVAVMLALEIASILSPSLRWQLFSLGALQTADFHPLPSCLPSLFRAVATLVMHAFLHGGIMHAAFNCLMLAALSPPVVAGTGSKGFLLLFVATAVAGGLAQVWLPGWEPGGAVGASGAVFGVAAARSELLARLRASMQGDLWRVRVQQAAGWMILNAAIVALSALLSRGSWMQSEIAWKAHAGGYLAGALLAPILLRRRAGWHDGS